MMLVRRKVAVKVIVTDEFKEQLLAQLRQAVQKVELTQQQLEYQGRRYLSEFRDKDPAQGEAFRRKLERQSRRQEEIRSKLTAELVRAENLQLGSEYLQGAVEGLTEIRVGDDLSRKLNDAEVITKDGVVVEIREY
jgi:hypothetical protein